MVINQQILILILTQSIICKAASNILINNKLIEKINKCAKLLMKKTMKICWRI